MQNFFRSPSLERDLIQEILYYFARSHGAYCRRQQHSRRASGTRIVDVEMLVASYLVPTLLAGEKVKRRVMMMISDLGIGILFHKLIVYLHLLMEYGHVIIPVESLKSYAVIAAEYVT